MPIADNLVSHIYAESGDSSITDKIQSQAVGGTGTATLTTVGAEDAWNLTSAAFTINVPSHALDTATQGTGVTFAVRYRINTFGSTGGFSKIFGVIRDDATKYLNVTKNGAGVRSQWNTTTQNSITGAETTATVITLVCVCYTNEGGGAAERINTWINQASRADNLPDFTGAGITSSAISVNQIYFDAPDTMDYDLLDFAYWDRELTDAEAAAVADDFRTQLPIGGGADTTPDAFSFADQTDVAVSTLITSNTITVTGIDSATPISVTGGEMSINTGAFTSTATTVNLNDTVQLRQTSSASNSTQTDVTLDIGGVTDIWSVTTVAASAGTITTGPFKNWVDGLQPGLTGIRVVILDLTSGNTIANIPDETTDAVTAVMSVTDAAIVTGTFYAVATISSDGTVVGIERIQAT